MIYSVDTHNPLPLPSLNLCEKWSDICSLVEFLIADGSWPEDAQYSPEASGLKHVQPAADGLRHFPFSPLRKDSKDVVLEDPYIGVGADLGS